MSSENIKSIVSAMVIISCLAFLGFLVHEKVDNSAVLALAIVPTLIAYFTRAPDKTDPPKVSGTIVAMGVGSLVAAALIMACAALPTPQQQGALVDTTCTILDAFANSPAEEAICATTEDLVALESSIRTSRVDAGTPDRVARTFQLAGNCKIVGTVCANDTELANAIRARKASKS